MKDDNELFYIGLLVCVYIACLITPLEDEGRDGQQKQEEEEAEEEGEEKEEEEEE